ncbi:SRPBCC family protein [Metabacillus arenae]|uniref:SRPBCC family protein n=1 Tax=Metabacillus arenae TaxID=2771434 RepID=A0A926NLH1_9BACI|nr:SRPBCC family protein [Metabacillus arenae]MBD1383260.1 SRPBCC family protein [Metabacillus arenae]
MNQFGTLHESNGRYALRFKRFFSYKPEEVFRVITDPSYFSQWYPFSTGEMDLRSGGKIAFDDGEGSTYEGIITELKKPHTFEFREVDDLIQISLLEEDEGCQMVFTHTFDDKEMAMYTAAGWHRCLDVLHQIVNGHPVEWKDNSVELREFYREAFDRIS